MINVNEANTWNDSVCVICDKPLQTDGYKIWFTCNCLHNGINYKEKESEDKE